MTGAELSSSNKRHRYASISSSIKHIFEISMMFALIIAFWQIVVIVFRPPQFLLPSPGLVWTALIDTTLQWPTAITTTAVEVGAGFALGSASGFILGLTVSWSERMSRLLLPVVIAFNTLPKIAIAPLFIIYLGFGIFPNIIITATVAFFSIVITTAAGVSQLSGDITDLANSVYAKKWRIYFHIRVPNSLPSVISGLKVSSSMAVAGAIVGEFVASRAGLGHTLIATQTSLQTAVAFAALIWMALLSLLLYAVIVYLAWLLVPWQRKKVY